jgi:molecular chaperone DnaK (HSP70)
MGKIIGIDLETIDCCVVATEGKEPVMIDNSKGNDELGSVIINFADKVIIGRSGTNYVTREYDNTVFAISVEPKRVQ